MGDSDIALSPDGNVECIAVLLHSGRVEGASLASRTDMDSTHRGHSSNRHGHLAAPLDMTWLWKLSPASREVVFRMEEYSKACR